MISAPDVKTALTIYYSSTALGSAEIMKLFGVSRSTAVNLKRQVQDAMAERGEKMHFPHSVNTALAFEVWGLDVEEMERRYKKLKELRLVQKEPTFLTERSPHETKQNCPTEREGQG